jgi:hypothetical protein
MTYRNSITIRRGMLAGAAGGLAEIAWVAVYAAGTGGDATELARGVTTTAGLNTVFQGEPVIMGLSIHMTLAVLLGIALAFAWRAVAARYPAYVSPFPFTLAALAGVWMINFFVILPLLSPAFAHLLPYGVSLMSKLLFGLAAAETLRRQDASSILSASLISNEKPLARTLS